MAGIGNYGSLQNPRLGSEARLKKKLHARGQMLKEWRIIRGISRTEMSRNIGVHWNTIAAWEDGGVIPRWAIERFIDMGWPQEQAFVAING